VFTIATSGFAFAGGLLPLVLVLTVVHGYAFGALGTINLAATIDLTGGKRAGVTMGWYTASLSTGYAVGRVPRRRVRGPLRRRRRARRARPPARARRARRAAPTRDRRARA